MPTAGQGAAERFYEWERKYDIEVSVAKLLGGKDPGDLAQSDPESLPLAIEQASPFLAFRIDRVLATMPSDTPEHRTRAAESAMAVVNEHPNVNVRKLYAGEVATRLDLPVHDLVLVAEKGGRAPAHRASARRRNAPAITQSSPCLRCSFKIGMQWRRGWRGHCFLTQRIGRL